MEEAEEEDNKDDNDNDYKEEVEGWRCKPGSWICPFSILTSLHFCLKKKQNKTQ